MEQPKKWRVGDGTPGPGRPKGSQSKIHALVKDMIAQALHEEGGVEYLRKQAREEPKAFLTLLGRILPLQVTGEGDGPMTIQVVTGVPRAGSED